MADVIKRLKYYNGQFLQEPDFTAEQEYHLDRQRRHNRHLHTPGIAHGLAVTAAVNTNSVSVAPGTAIDDQGRQVVLHEPATVGFDSSHNGQSVLVVISYAQEESDDATVGDAGKTRWLERPKVEAILESSAPPASERIRLARLQINGSGLITSADMGVRVPSGARLRPAEMLERLTLSRQGTASVDLTSGAAGRADVGGDLNVTGNILVTGTVDGRDISADATVNQAHRDNTNNPHGVTALQVGALVSIEGVSNAGGNIDLVGAGGISIAGNDGANTITITGSAPSSIQNVSNPGGNIAINGTGGISVVGNDGANTITVSTSLGALGAFPAGDYLRRVVTNGSFSSWEGTKSIWCGFLPKVIAVTWSIYGDFSGRVMGFNSTAYVDVFSTFSWTVRGSWHYINRLNSAPYWDNKSAGGYGSLVWLDFTDFGPSPDRNTEMQVNLDSVSNSGFVLRQTRWTSTVPITVYFQLVILG
jgi:hypothetical protein